MGYSLNDQKSLGVKRLHETEMVPEDYFPRHMRILN